MRILITDSYYTETDCYTVGVILDSWTSTKPVSIISCHTDKFMSYIPGEFYKRELPGILSLLKQVDITRIDFIVIDGYVRLMLDSGEVRPGLGEILWNKIKNANPNITVIGLAKTLFGKSNLISEPLKKKRTRKPLWISVIGNSCSIPEIVNLISKMPGKTRIPDMISLTDRLTKNNLGED